MSISVPRPDAVRTLPRNFAWIDRRLRDKTFLGELYFKELALYVFFVLAADKNGISYYRSENIAKHFDFQIHPTEVLTCRNRLIEKGLIAFSPFSADSCEGVHQVLPLPKTTRYISPDGEQRTMVDFDDIVKNLSRHFTSDS